MVDNAAPGTAFGVLLRQWRTSRRISQLDLAHKANTTSRHLSFLETGRSRPGADVIDRLCEALQVPLGDRNELLLAAGLAPRYPQEDFESERYAPARRAITQLLGVHEPFPGLVFSADGLVVSSNQGAERLFGENLTGRSILGWMLATGHPEHRIANWPELARATLARLRLECARLPFDPIRQEALRVTVKTVEAMHGDTGGDDDLAVCPTFIVGERRVRTLVLAAKFDHARDVTIEGLRVELIYPLDDEAEQFFRDPLS